MILDCYRLLYKVQGSDEWEIYKPLMRNQNFGTAFDTLQGFPKGTHRQIVKKYFWKTYKIDIDKLLEWQKLDHKELHENEFKYWYNKMFCETSTY